MEQFVKGSLNWREPNDSPDHSYEKALDDLLIWMDRHYAGATEGSKPAAIRAAGYGT